MKINKERVPGVRFIGFNDEWKQKQVSEIFELTRGKVIPKTSVKDKYNSEYSFPVYSSQTLNNGIMGYLDSYMFDGNYLTWTTDGANAGDVNYRKGKFNCTNVCGLLVEKIGMLGYANRMVSEALKIKAPKYVSYVGNPKLMNNVMSEIKVFLPELSEQTKIAEFFTTLDERIQIQQSIVENLEKLKKGYMQKIFSQELRFKDENGEDFPEWEPMAVGNMLLDYSERVGGRSIQAVSVGTLGIRKRSDIFSKELSNNLSGNKIFRKNQICFGLGTNNIVYGVLIDNETFCVSPAYKIFNIVNVSPLFFEKLMDFHNKRLSQLFMIKSARQGKTVDFDSLLQDRVLICSSKEQNIIVQYFLILEKKLELEKNKLLKFQELKHGYLQKMFV